LEVYTSVHFDGTASSIEARALGVVPVIGNIHRHIDEILSCWACGKISYAIKIGQLPDAIKKKT
jgi:hypothetical protein